MSLCGISRRRLIAGTAAAAALSQVSAESLSIASAARSSCISNDIIDGRRVSCCSAIRAEHV